MPDPADLPVQSQPATWGSVLAAASGLLAAWADAGSLGLIAPPLEHAVVWLCLATAVVSAWPFRPALPGEATALRLTGTQWGVIFAALLVIVLYAWLPGVGGALGVALVLVALAGAQVGSSGRVLRTAAFAVAGFGLYRFAYQTVPAVWMLADLLGQGLGRLVGLIFARPLRVGATFAGVDFLVLMAGVYGAWLMSTPRPRGRRAASVAGIILTGHLVFLILLAFAPQIAAWLPAAPPPPEAELEQTPLWFWGDALRAILPWSLPLVAGLIHAAVVVLIFRWTDCGHPLMSAEASPGRHPRLRLAYWAASIGLALLVPVVATLMPFRADLSGRTIAVFERGLFDWGRPTYGRYGDSAAGTLGMLPELVASLHGRLIRSANLSASELQQADVLVLVHPTRPWSQQQLQRVWDYVRRGGALLMVAENRMDQGGVTSAFDEILAPTSIRVRNDAALSANTDWEGSLEPSGCAAAVDVPSAQNPFGIEAGSSLEIGWRACPLLVGRYGRSAVGDDAGRDQAGARLGDLVLAAQQRFGRGRVVVLGDTNPFTNLGSVSAYPFTCRLLSWMASRGADPQAWWRQAVAICGALGLIALLLNGGASGLCSAVLAFLTAMIVCTVINAKFSEVLPDGRPAEGGPSRLAYIGAAHLEGHAGASWADDGVNGLALHLMRSGRLALLLPQLDAARLERAGMLISIAPGRPFSPDERDLIQRFVDRGGIWICTVGAEQSRVVAPLLAEFDFRVPHSPVGPDETAQETEAVGSFFAPYYQNEQGQAEVMFQEGWPIACDARDITVHVQSNEGAAFVATRPVGQGMVAVIGDAKFALNKNLERSDGQPLDEGYRNADFWRWFTTVLQRQPPWTPPLGKPERPAKGPAKEARQ